MQNRAHIKLLGDFRVAMGDEPVAALNTPRLQTLLAYLLLHQDAPQSRQHLAFLLWPDSSEEQALANLRNLLFKLRSVLPITGHYLKSDRNTLLWQGDSALEVDVLRFEQALGEAERAARRGDTRGQAAHLQEAVDLYRGDLLPSSYDDWVLAERERLQQRFTSALESLITLFEQQANVQGAIEASQRLLRHNPLHEAVYLRLMELYAANDMVPEALRVYHTCATTLERELGVEPGPNTRQAYERLLSSRKTTRMQNAEGDERRRTKGERRRTTGRGQRTKESPQPATRNPQPTPPFRIPLSPPLIGRASEWALLQEVWQEVSQGVEGEGGGGAGAGGAVSRAVLVRGEAGIGKSRLVEELFNQVTRQGGAAASARCYPVERRLAFGPVAGWLRALPIPRLSPVWLSEVARLRPDILDEFQGTPAPGPLTEAWQRIHFMEAISRVLLAGQPLFLFLDDLQWCDPDTLEYLHFLLRTSHDQGSRLLLAMSARVEELDALADVEQAQALTHFLDSLRDAGQLLEIDLAPLGLEESAKLAASLSAGEEIDPSQAARLYRETEGYPLFIVEMLRTSGMRNVEFGMRNEPMLADLSSVVGGRWSVVNFPIPHSEGLPPRIAHVLNERLAQLSPTARATVDVAAVIGRDFALPLLQIAAHESESVVVQAIDELWRRRIVREQGPDGYDFSHDKLRQAAYSALTSARRRMLHGRVARALEEVYAGRLGPVSAQLGMHYEAAGDLIQAARYYRRAAEAAQQLFANTEAISLYERAFALAQQTASSSPGEAESDSQKLMVEIGESLADLLDTVGDHARARSTYQQALDCCPQTRPLWRDRLILKIGDTWRAQRQFDKAVEFYDRFEGLLGEEPAAGEEEWWALRIEGTVARLMTHYWQSEPTEMLKLDEKMRPSVERHGSRLQKMKYYRCLATMHLRLDRYATSDECMRHIRAALEETIPLNNLTELTDTTFLMGFCLLWRGVNRPDERDLPSAIDHLQQALSLAERTGKADYKLLSLAYLTIAYRMQGDVQKSRDTIALHLDYMHQVQSPSYRETAEANLAWVAWKDGDLEAAERHALTALPLFGTGESFAWLVTWPLVAVSLARGDLAGAVRYAAAQLALHLQRAPDVLVASVKAAIQAWDSGQSDQAAMHLRQALAAAHECGYI